MCIVNIKNIVMKPDFSSGDYYSRGNTHSFRCNLKMAFDIRRNRSFFFHDNLKFIFHRITLFISDKLSA